MKRTFKAWVRVRAGGECPEVRITRAALSALPSYPDDIERRCVVTYNDSQPRRRKVNSRAKRRGGAK